MGRRVTSGVAGGNGLGALNIVSSTITSTQTNSDIVIEPNGTGDLYFNADTVRLGDENADVLLTTWGTSDAIINTNSGTNSGSIRIYNGANGNITLEPNGTGTIQLGTSASTPVSVAGSASINSASITATTTSTDSSSGALVVAGGVGVGENLNVDANLGVGGDLTIDGSLTVSSIAGISGYVSQDTAATLDDADKQYIVSNSTPITLTLPNTSTDGRTITVVDGNNFGTFNVTLARNTKTIGGLSEDLVLNVQNSRIELVYKNGDWKVFAS